MAASRCRWALSQSMRCSPRSAASTTRSKVPASVRAPTWTAWSSTSRPMARSHLSQRTYNCLKRSQITKVGQILQMSENELLSLRNFGQKSLVELREKLQEHGVLPESVGGTDGTGTLGDSIIQDESAGDQPEDEE